MSWRADTPDGRVFALVLPRGHTEPFVGQYDPGMGTWASCGDSPSSPCVHDWKDVEWHPLPRHPRFLDKTHAVDESPCGRSSWIDDVAEFQRASGAPVVDRPEIPSGERALLRLSLIGEECDEVADALDSCVWSNADADADDAPALAELADGLADLIYVCICTALEFGIPLDEAWRKVHRSNMAKFPGGKVYLDSNGKVTKPPGWQKPDVEGVIRRAMGGSK